MMFRLLRDQVEHAEIEVDGIKVEFDVKVISTSEQARLMDLAGLPATIENRSKYWQQVLISCIDNLVIGGQSVDAVELATRGDLGHKQTIKIMREIASKAEDYIFVTEEEVKKSDG